MEGEDRGEKAVAAMEACYQGFDPAAYLQYNYTPPRADFTRSDSIVPWKLKCLHEAFSEGERLFFCFLSSYCSDSGPQPGSYCNIFSITGANFSFMFLTTIFRFLTVMYLY